jgi:peroxiredoxin family protein
MKSNTPNEAGRAVIEAVENQLDENDPPKVGQTLKRLISEGIDREEALKYIACALSVEIFGIMKNSESFNPIRYDANLDGLPDMPWEDED